ncbi:MAG: tetratricopeptide repeat protein [Thermodesulfobacteriota bacterium]|nr:tetratricopeptide repeat protein [Thermodesulfobacteriota bacterium]
MESRGWKNKSLLIVFVLSMLGLAAHCASKEEKEARHLQRAEQYIEEGKLKEAVIELRNVVQLNPKNDEAYYELGESYLKLKQPREAFQAFSQAVSANPDNLNAQTKLGRMLLLGKKTKEAREKAEQVLAKTPDNVDALELLAGAQVQEKDIAAAIVTLERASSLDPKRLTTFLSLGRLFTLRGEYDKAENAYRRAMMINPESNLPYVEMSRSYAGRGKWAEAESELKNMVKAPGTKHRKLVILARFYESRKNWDLAEKTYLLALDVAPKEDVSSLMSLGAYYVRRKSYDKALEYFKRAAEAKKDDLDILAAIAQLHFDFKQIKASEQAADKVLEKAPGHLRANLLKGRIFLIHKNYTGAHDIFDRVVRDYPGNAMAFYYKGMSLLGKGDAKLGEQDLLKALELKPGLLDARLILAEYYLRTRNQTPARQQVEAAEKIAPTNIQVMMLKGNLNLLARDIKGAEEAFAEVVKQAPDYSPGYVKLGLVHNLAKRKEKALDLFKKAMALDPIRTDALGYLVDIYVRDKEYNKAIRACEDMKKKNQGSPVRIAFIQYLEGRVFMVQKDLKKAKGHFEEAIKADPNMIAPYVLLARIYIKEGNPEQAIAQYEAVLEKNPDYVAGYMALGSIHDQQKERKKAETYYRKALEIRPDFAPAANNLAWNLVEGGGNIDEALGFAQIAKEKMPNNASVMDTLGWLYYLKGRYLSAIAEFEDSLSREPDNPVINYHLGMAYYKNSNPDKARKFLQKSLALDDSFDKAEEARAILSEIEVGGPGSG